MLRRAVPPFVLSVLLATTMTAQQPSAGQPAKTPPAPAPKTAPATPSTAGPAASPSGAPGASGVPGTTTSAMSGPPPKIPAVLSGPLSLSLQDAIALGIKNNLNVQVERFAPPIAQLQNEAAWGAYDPNLVSNFDYSSHFVPVANPFVGQTAIVTRTTGGKAGIQGLLPKLGWQYDISYNAQQVTTDSPLSTLSPEYDSYLTATAELPLLKGFLWGGPWVQVKTTGIASQVAYDQFRQQLMDTVRAIEGAYWNLAAQGENLAVAQKSRETAKALLDQTKAQFQVGVVSKVEVVQAQAGLADREFKLITAENQYRAAQDQLVDLVLGTHLRPDTRVKVELTDSPEKYRTFQVDEEVAAQKAFKHRPELAIAKQQISQQAIQLKFAENQRLPQVDLRATYGYQGLAGQANPNRLAFGPPSTPNVQPNYTDTFNDFFRYDRTQWSAGVVFSVPFPNRTGRAGVMENKLALRRAKAQERQVEQAIILDVRNSVRNLRSALEGIQAAKRAVEAANEQLRAEQIRLQHGESTPYEVLLREQDLVTAENQQTGALRVYHDSVAALDRAQGTILRDRNVVVDRALSLR